MHSTTLNHHLHHHHPRQSSFPSPTFIPLPFICFVTNHLFYQRSLPSPLFIPPFAFHPNHLSPPLTPAVLASTSIAVPPPHPFPSMNTQKGTFEMAVIKIQNAKLWTGRKGEDGNGGETKGNGRERRRKRGVRDEREKRRGRREYGGKGQERRETK